MPHERGSHGEDAASPAELHETRPIALNLGS
jgi:hypothetical protein